MKSTLLAAALLFSACSGFTKGPTAPDAPPVSSFAPLPMHDAALRLLVGADWTGVETADVGHGENGTLNATFYSGGADGYVSARLQFQGRLETVNGSLSGTLDNLAIVADASGTPTGTRCQYGAHGVRAEETGRGGGQIEVIAGRYEGRGPDPCPNKAGTFRLQRPLIPPPCVGGGTLPFAPGQFLAVFPPDFPNPWYPFALAPVPFTIPIGQWSFSAVTGDDHALKHDPPQLFEIVQFALYGAGGNLLGTLGPTIDVPDAVDRQDSPLGSLTLAEAVASVKVSHGYVGPPVTDPTHSVYPVSLTFTCPVR